MPPAPFSNWRMVLIPPVARALFLDRAELRNSKCDGGEDGVPFLLAGHEVTNGDYFTFIKSEEGKDWRPERMTKARGRVDLSRSRYPHLSNEYHLFYWEAQPGAIGAELPIYRPPLHHYEHPVSYVSWWACAAFCIWLNKGSGRRREYSLPSATGEMDDVGIESNMPPGYRLPDVAEWWWAAQSGQGNVEYPWDLYPFHLPPGAINQLSALASRDTYAEMLLSRISQERDNAMRWLIEKSHDTHPVGDDFFPAYGVFGLIGNVKEWCDTDAVESRSKKKLILGASSVLGEDSFSFRYAIPLFPENTNPDVGFRIARSLSDSELGLLRSREREIANNLM